MTGRETNFETGRSIVYVSASRETPFLITHEKLAFPVTFSSDGIWHILGSDVLNVNDAIQSIELDWSKLTSLNFVQEREYRNCALDFTSANYSEKTIEVEASFILKSSEGFVESVTDENSNIKYDTKYDLSNFQACRNQIYQDIDEANAKFRHDSGRYLRNTYAPIAPTSLYFLSECDSGSLDIDGIYRIKLGSFSVRVSINLYWFKWYSSDYI